MKILIVEDHENLSILFSKMLKVSGHEAVVANGGRNGLAMILENKFDAIVLDLAMPDFSGYQVIDELEKDNSIKNYKIVVLTATAISQEKIDHLKNQGVKTVLKKPIQVDTLIEALKNVTGQ